jgi:protein-S-isoprenylcysteine O-methyltransferase Ste14
MKPQPLSPEIKRKIYSWIFGIAAGMAIYAALLVLSSGKWDWFWGWVFMALMILAMAAHVLVLVPINPALLADRAGGMRQPGAKRWDIRLTITASLFFFGIVVVAGLDERWGWTGDIAPGWHLAGGLLFVTHWTLFIWAMACNPFFSESVRIQENHQVAQRGPYRLVRHPGYLGNLLGCLGQPLLLGSWWAFIPAILTILAFVLRTSLEDKTLQKELPGYSEYTQQVRYRLIPGLW